MIAYTVHEPIEPSSDLVKRAEQVVFVKEGVAWLALLFPVIWLAIQRMWIGLAAFIGLALAVSALVLALGANEQAAAWSSIVLSAFFAIQANDLRRWALERAGYEMVAAVSGRGSEECEMKFFAQLTAELENAARDAAGTLTPPQRAGGLAKKRDGALASGTEKTPGGSLAPARQST